MYEYAAKLVRIIDGDTFVAQLDLGFKTHKIETVRLSGINTPESRTRNAEEKRHGLAAKKFLGAALVKAEKITVMVKDIGKYGRAIGIVYVDGLNINFELIDKGYAYPYSGERKLEYDEMTARFAAMYDVRKSIENAEAE